MEVVYVFLIFYVIMFLIDYFILKNLGKYKINEYEYLRKKFKLKKKKPKFVKLVTSLLNAFILSLVCILSFYLNVSLFIILIVAFISLFILTYIVYEIYGKILKKQEKTKN